ncbi:MAG: NADH-quinone oxidoreductase subunit C, partial [Pseudomonadota bacterium]
MTSRIDTLSAALNAALGDKLVSITVALGEVTLVVGQEHLVTAAVVLRDAPELRFEQLVDLCGIDFSDYGDGAWDGQRYAVVYHLLSLAHNRRLRLRVFAADDEFPV